jgi:hypothetical protein
MRMKPFIAAVMILVCLPFLSFAQEDEGRDEVTVEELYLENIELGLIRAQAMSTNRDAKLRALENLEEMIASGKVTPESADALLLLDYLAMEGVSRQVRMNGRLINYFPMVRKKAVELLGKVKGETAKDILLDVLSEDNEPMVKAEAAYALGLIGLNENEEVTRALAYELMNQTAVAPDDNFAYAVMLSYEKIAAANNGIREPSVYLSLIQVSQGNYVKAVREKALDVMDVLRTYG